MGFTPYYTVIAISSSGFVEKNGLALTVSDIKNVTVTRQ